jgi:hypothetical protein
VSVGELVVLVVSVGIALLGIGWTCVGFFLLRARTLKIGSLEDPGEATGDDLTGSEGDL